MTDTTAIWTSRPARSRQAVVFCADNAAYPLAEVLGRRVAASEPSLDVVVCVERPDHLPSRVGNTSPLRYATLGMQARLDGLPTSRAIPKSTYARLLLPEALGSDYDRILYLDADILPVEGALTPLLDAPMNGAAVAAAPDLRAFEAPPADLRQSYRNAGIQLLDCREGRAAEAFARVLAYARRHAHALPQHDQTALNEALRTEMALLSPRWNFIHTPAMLPHLALVDPVILHFTGHDKPWVVSGNAARMAYHSTFTAMLDSLFTAEDLAYFGLWGTEAGGQRKYRLPLLERLSRWNRQRNLRRRARSRPVPQPVPAAVVRRFLAEADIQ